MKEFYVYYLYVEGENDPFYVGKSYVGSKRLINHICKSKHKNTMKSAKINKSLSEGKKVLEKIIFKSYNEQEAFAFEREEIAKLGRLDMKTGILCNHTDGGEGTSGKTVVFSQEHRTKISQSAKGRVRKPWKCPTRQKAIKTYI